MTCLCALYCLAYFSAGEVPFCMLFCMRERVIFVLSQVDEEFGRAKDASQVGTTAVVALVGDRQLYVGNCGAHHLHSHSVLYYVV